MLQTSTFINYYNRGFRCYYHAQTNQLYWILLTRGLTLSFISQPLNNIDFFNLHSSAYRWAETVTAITPLPRIISLFLMQWAKLAFRGKSFRVRNFCKNNKFTFNFGYSHWTKLKLAPRWGFFKRKRQRYLIFTFFYKDFCCFKRFFPTIKRYNCYTMRGLRFKKQAIIKRFGKLSQHISSLH